MILFRTVLLAATVLVALGFVLLNTRNEARSKAEQEAANVQRIVLEDVRTQFGRYSSLLDVASSMLSGANPVPPEIAARLLRKMAQDEGIVSNLLVLDHSGLSTVHTAPSGKPRDSFADRDFFIVHRDRADAGLFVSAPYPSRAGQGEQAVILSRRVFDSEGNFAGVVAAEIRLQHFAKLFADLDLGERSAVALVNSQGTVLVREPSANGAGDTGRSIASGAVFKRISAGLPGPVVTVGSLDGIERMVTYGKVTDFPLIVTVSQSTSVVYKEWWEQAAILGLLALVVCALSVFLAAALQQKIDELDAARAALAEAAVTDALTALPNRRAFELAIRREWQRASRDRTSLSVLLIDADFFKQVNDLLGHAAGDDVLKQLAGLLAANVKRQSDLVARYGGEEFAVLLPVTDKVGALHVAETLRKAVEGWAEDARQNGKPAVTVSVGISSIIPDSRVTEDQFMETADRALYEAKRRGRNQSRFLEISVDHAVVPLPTASRALLRV